MKRQLHLIIGGMTCINCQNRIQRKLSDTKGIDSVSVSYEKGCADIEYDDATITPDDIIQIIHELDYSASFHRYTGKSDIINRICMVAIILALFYLIQRTGLLNLLVPSQLADSQMGFGMLFVIGLITSVHCIAMCGGINLSQTLQGVGQDETGKQKQAFLPAFLYNAGRIVSYTLIGLILGTIGWILGSTTSAGPSNLLQGIIKILAGLFMIIMGLNMLNIFPFLRRLSIRLPNGVLKYAAGSKLRGKGPFFVGLLNGLMPCGPLQAMWLVAAASSNPITGALSMFCFSLGTVPLMLGFGSMAALLGKKFTKQVTQVGAVLVVVMGLAIAFQGTELAGFFTGLPSGDSSEGTYAQIADNKQVVNSTLSSGKYPNITVTAGMPVEWIIDAPEESINGCNYKMIIADLGIEYTFEPGENIIEFTPEETGTIHYTCWMGMISGNIFVVSGDEGAAAEASDNIDVPKRADVEIPAEALAVAEIKEDSSYGPYQEVTINLSEEGFSPAVIVLQKDTLAIWNINNTSEETEIAASYYATKLSLSDGENSIQLLPSEDFDLATGDYDSFCYVKVVDTLDDINEDEIRSEVTAYVPMIYPESVYQKSNMSCCQ